MKNQLLAALVLCVGPTLVAAEDVAPGDVAFSDGAVLASLTGAVGDAVAGRAAFINRKQGNCLACHANAEIPEQSFHGEVGPPLDFVAERWTAEELRGIVSNAKMMFPDTIMPAFYNGLEPNRSLKKFAGKTVLSAQQVEDIVAYLQTLSE
ncbi:MAG: sulfur oxidation c-type cytochrome SoxX [Yoonia sp.]|nr:sulfur oxidation c-type cytochrome SoxX [Yoonia sp.]